MDQLIDYTKCVKEVFSKLIELLLPWVGLRLLVATRHPHNLRMASWVPDWSQNLPLDVYQFLYLDPSGLAKGSHDREFNVKMKRW